MTVKELEDLEDELKEWTVKAEIASKKFEIASYDRQRNHEEWQLDLQKNRDEFVVEGKNIDDMSHKEIVKMVKSVIRKWR